VLPAAGVAVNPRDAGPHHGFDGVGQDQLASTAIAVDFSANPLFRHLMPRVPIVSGGIYVDSPGPSLGIQGIGGFGLWLSKGVDGESLYWFNTGGKTTISSQEGLKMSLLKRMTDLVRSNVNDLLDKAEDPKKILEQAILDMQNEHKKAKKMLIDTMTLLKKTEKDAERARQSGKDWEGKAMAALKGGNEELARRALEEKQKQDEIAEEMDQNLVQQRAYTNELKTSIKQLESKIEEAKKKRDELLRRMQAAEAQKKQAEAMSGEGPKKKDWVNDSNAFDTFDRMVGKIENNEAEVDAMRELSGLDKADELAELEKLGAGSSTDAALAELKAKMAADSGQAPAPSAPAAESTGEGAEEDPKTQAIDDELAALRAKLEGGGS
jgi:phage shock protein A